MTQVTEHITVCDYCQGEIPDAADQIRGVNGTLVLDQAVTPVADMDFCCSAHMALWVAAMPQVAQPNPPYQPPPGVSLPTTPPPG